MLLIHRNDACCLLMRRNNAQPDPASEDEDDYEESEDGKEEDGQSETGSLDHVHEKYQSIGRNALSDRGTGPVTALLKDNRSTVRGMEVTSIEGDGRHDVIVSAGGILSDRNREKGLPILDVSGGLDADFVRMPARDKPDSKDTLARSSEASDREFPLMRAEIFDKDDDDLARIGIPPHKQSRLGSAGREVVERPGIMAHALSEAYAEGRHSGNFRRRGAEGSRSDSRAGTRSEESRRNSRSGKKNLHSCVRECVRLCICWSVSVCPSAFFACVRAIECLSRIDI